MPRVESLEERQLLSLYTGPSTTRPIASNGSMFTISVTGGGFQTVKRLKGGQLAINLYSTNANSQVVIDSQKLKAHFSNAQLDIARINVKTGQLGSITAGSANLLGPMTPLNNSVSAISFGTLGRNATVDVNGDLGELNVGLINLGPTGKVHVGGNLTGSLGGSIHLDGGRLVIDNDVTGTLNPSNLLVERGGILAVGHDVSGGIDLAGRLEARSNGLINIGHNLAGMKLGRGLSLQGGRFVVGNDLTGETSISSSAEVTDQGLFNVGRDLAGSFSIQDDLTLDRGGSVVVGRDVASLLVGGSLIVQPTGGFVGVQGNLNQLTINGSLTGKGSPLFSDLFVGLNLNDLTVAGGGANQGGIQNANIEVVKNLFGFDVHHGVFHSLITAGVLIDGAGDGSNGSGANIGADGVDAILNSEIRAGMEIRNFTIGGDVRSEFALNPDAKGYPTRIVAGQDRSGNYLTGGTIRNFQITGTMIDSVIAASVAPSGGDGTLPPGGYAPPRMPTGDPTQGTYDAPAGVIFGGTVGSPVPYPNYSAITYYNETFKELAYNLQLSPNPDDFIMPGSINADFASTPLSQAQLSDASSATLPLPLPTKSTVLGGVVSHTHVGQADFAGIFAADTRGVFVGTLPDR